MGVGLGLTAISSCLSLNQDFQVAPERAAHASTGSNVQNNSDGDNTAPEGVDASDNPTSPPSQDNTTSNPTPTDESTSSSPESNDTSTSSTSSTESETSTIPPLSARSKVEVDASAVTEALLSGYPISLTFNHRSLVDQGAAPDGSDLAMISVRSGTTTSLPRVLARESGWNQTDTKIWFTIDQSIQAGSIEQDSYFLVTQDPSVTPVDDRSRVFQDFNDFSSDPLSSAGWSLHLSAVGDREINQSASFVALTASPLDSYPLSYATLRQQATTYWPSIRIDAMTRFTNTGLSGSCGRIFPIALTTEGDNRIRAGYRSDISNYAALSYDEVQGINQVTPIATATPVEDTWQLHSLVWRGSDISYWRDNVELLETQSQGTITQPNQSNLQLEFSVGARSVDCTGSGTLGLEIDWYRVRRYTFPEPVAQIAP